MKIDEIMAKVDEVNERINLIKGKKKYITLNDIMNKYPYLSENDPMLYILYSKEAEHLTSVEKEALEMLIKKLYKLQQLNVKQYKMETANYK